MPTYDALGYQGGKARAIRSTDTLNVPGDLVVAGTTTTINSTSVNIADNFMNLNKDSLSTAQAGGISVQHGVTGSAHTITSKGNSPGNGAGRIIKVGSDVASTYPDNTIVYLDAGNGNENEDGIYIVDGNSAFGGGVTTITLKGSGQSLNAAHTGIVELPGEANPLDGATSFTGTATVQKMLFSALRMNTSGAFEVAQGFSALPTFEVAVATTEAIQDAAGALVASGGTKTGITITYQDADNDMDFVLDFGIADTKVLQSGAVTANQFLKVHGSNNKIISRDGAGVLADIGAQASNAKLTDIAGLGTGDGNFIVGNGSNFVAESGATARTSLGLGDAAVLNKGISANNLLQADANLTANQFVKVHGSNNTVVSTALSKADVGLGNVDNISEADIQTNMTKAHVGLANVDNTADANQVATGALNGGSITSGFGAINNGNSGITSSGTVDVSAGTIKQKDFNGLQVALNIKDGAGAQGTVLIPESVGGGNTRFDKGNKASAVVPIAVLAEAGPSGSDATKSCCFPGQIVQIKVTGSISLGDELFLADANGTASATAPNGSGEHVISLGFVTDHNKSGDLVKALFMPRYVMQA
tara:strand:+ start:14542 stop:16311 length:1770 start_codon:yes stop_codon:yes gene_type:complete